MRDLPTSLAHIIRQIVLTPADTILQKTSDDLADELKRQESFICQSSIVKSFLDTLIDSVCSGTARVCIALCSWGCVYVNFVLGTYCIVVSGPCQLHLLPYRVAGSVRLVHELFFLFFFLLLRVSLCAGAGVLGGAVYVWKMCTCLVSALS